MKSFVQRGVTAILGDEPDELKRLLLAAEPRKYISRMHPGEAASIRWDRYAGNAGFPAQNPSTARASIQIITAIDNPGVNP